MLPGHVGTAQTPTEPPLQSLVAPSTPLLRWPGFHGDRARGPGFGTGGPLQGAQSPHRSDLAGSLLLLAVSPSHPGHFLGHRDPRVTQPVLLCSGNGRSCGGHRGFTVTVRGPREGLTSHNSVFGKLRHLVRAPSGRAGRGVGLAGSVVCLPFCEVAHTPLAPSAEGTDGETAGGAVAYQPGSQPQALDQVGCSRKWPCDALFLAFPTRPAVEKYAWDVGPQLAGRGMQDPPRAGAARSPQSQPEPVESSGVGHCARALGLPQLGSCHGILSPRPFVSLEATPSCEPGGACRAAEHGRHQTLDK